MLVTYTRDAVETSPSWSHKIGTTTRRCQQATYYPFGRQRVDVRHGPHADQDSDGNYAIDQIASRARAVSHSTSRRRHGRHTSLSRHRSATPDRTYLYDPLYRRRPQRPARASHLEDYTYDKTGIDSASR